MASHQRTPEVVKYSKIIQVTLFTTSQVFVVTSPIIFDDGGAQAPKKVTLNPHQNRCSNHCHPGDLEKKTTSNIREPRARPWQTLHFPMGKNQHIYAQFSCYSWTCRGFEWFNSIQCLFTRFCSLGGLVGMNFGLHLQVTFELWLLLSLLVIIAVGLHQIL